MDQRTLIDLKSISGKGIKSGNLFQKPSLYAVISVTDPSAPDRQQKQKTAVDSDGGENPEWDGTFTFTFNRSGLDLSLEIDLMAQGNLLLLSGDRLVGRVHVLISDLLTAGSDGSLRHVSYQVIGIDGKSNGVMYFSYKISCPDVKFPPPLPAVSLPMGGYYAPQYQPDSLVASPPCNFYPPPGQQFPAVSSPYSVYSPPPVVPTSPGNYHQPPRQHDPAVASPAGSFYPPLDGLDPVGMPPTDNYYHLPRHQESVSPSSFSRDYYPVPRHQEPVSPSSSSRDYYPPPRQQPPAFYSPPPADAGYYPPPSQVHLAYPAPSAPPCCYPTPQQPCCYPAPAPRDAPESWDQRHVLYR